MPFGRHQAPREAHSPSALSREVKQCPRSKPLPRLRPVCIVANSSRHGEFGSMSVITASSHPTERNEFSARRGAQCVVRFITRLGFAVIWPLNTRWSSPKRRRGGSHVHARLSGARWLHAPRRRGRRGMSGRRLQQMQASVRSTRLEASASIPRTRTSRRHGRPRQSPYSWSHATQASARIRTSRR